MLGADGQADGVLIDLLLGQLLIVQLAVGGGGRVDDKALHVRYVGQQREDLQVINEGKGLLAAALDVKGKDGCTAVGGLVIIKKVVQKRLWAFLNPIFTGGFSKTKNRRRFSFGGLSYDRRIKNDLC